MKNKYHPMPDYDPKDIPTLDDIIAKGITDNSNIEIEEAIAASTEAETEAIPFDINAFLGDSGAATETSVTAETESRSGELDDLLKPEEDTDELPLTYEEIGESDSFLDDDKADVVLENTAFTTSEYYADDDDYEYIIDAQTDEAAEQVSVDPISVGTIVKDVVKQMMPDLEQQLVFLLQKAIEEKMPAELIKPADTDNDSGEDN